MAVLSAMLAVLCCIYGYGIVCPSLVYAGLSLFIMCRPYVNMVVCVVYAYNLAHSQASMLASTLTLTLGGVKALHTSISVGFSFRFSC